MPPNPHSDIARGIAIATVIRTGRRAERFAQLNVTILPSVVGHRLLRVKRSSQSSYSSYLGRLSEEHLGP